MTQSDIKTALLDVIQFHKAMCKDPECNLRHTTVWLDIFHDLGITLTKEEAQIIS